MGPGVPTGVGGEHVGRVRHQGNLVGAHAEHQFHKSGVWVALHVEFRGDHRAQVRYVGVPNVAFVRTRVYGDAVGAKRLNALCGLQHVGDVAAARVAQGGYFVDVHGEFGGSSRHGAKVGTEAMGRNFPYLWRVWNPIIRFVRSRPSPRWP